MDYLQKLYKSSMRPFRDRPDILVPGRWYWSPPGAKVIPYLHAFGSHRWDSWDRVDESPVGERRQRDGFNNKATPVRYTGQNWCGSQDVWENGLIYAAGGTTPVDSEGYPLCCLTTAPQNGGAMAEGVAEYVGPDDFVLGGIGLGGDVADVLDAGIGLGGDVADVLDAGIGLGGDLLETGGGMGLEGGLIDVMEGGVGLGGELVELLEGGVGVGEEPGTLEVGVGLGSDLIDLVEGGIGLGEVTGLIDLVEGGVGLGGDLSDTLPCSIPADAWSTGLDEDGDPLAIGDEDPHWTCDGVPAIKCTLDIPAIGGNWLVDDEDSQWISLAEDPTGGDDVTYVFSTSFTVTDTAYTVKGRASSDWDAEIWLNGVDTGVHIGHWNEWTSFTLFDGLIEGVNTLEIRVYADTGPMGLRVQFGCGF